MNIFEIVMLMLSVLALSVIGFDSACSIYYGLKDENKRKHKEEKKPERVKRNKIGYNITCEKKITVCRNKEGKLDMILRV